MDAETERCFVSLPESWVTLHGSSFHIQMKADQITLIYLTSQKSQRSSADSVENKIIVIIIIIKKGGWGLVWGHTSDLPSHP